jgi:SNF2 family DNA or RNA helicase
MSNQAAHYLQSVDRIHRRGQTRDVEYLILLCDRTIELVEYDRLITKKRAGQELLGDRIDEPITREAMLSEAMNALYQLGEEP